MTAGLPGTAVHAAHATVDRLATRIPTAAAVAWVHTGALVRHALDHGLVDDHGSLTATLAALAAAHPALTGLTDPQVNPALTVPAPDLTPVEHLWQAHPIPDPPYRTDGRRLGDLYQALSAESRKSRALCQTPQFVSDLLWDLTVPDAVAAFGPDIRLIDPACGTGHMLVEAVIRLPSVTSRPGSIEQALAAVHGVDIDPYAAQIARYRLLALACGSHGRRWTASQAPADLPIQVAAADSLLDDAQPLLRRARYHVALANPPYITVKDPAANAAIRARYRQTCHGKFSLALPFLQLINELLVPGGFCAQLTANSFMKRQFGRPFIEQYLPAYDLTWVIDTSGAYIPGHGTPTVILVHRNQPPARSTVTTIRGVRGEPTAPADPARGLVWTAIRRAVDDILSARRFAAGAAAWAAAQPSPAAAVPRPGRCASSPPCSSCFARGRRRRRPRRPRSEPVPPAPRSPHARRSTRTGHRQVRSAGRLHAVPGHRRREPLTRVRETGVVVERLDRVVDRGALDRRSQAQHLREILRCPSAGAAPDDHMETLVLLVELDRHVVAARGEREANHRLHDLLVDHVHGPQLAIGHLYVDAHAALRSRDHDAGHRIPNDPRWMRTCMRHQLGRSRGEPARRLPLARGQVPGSYG